jgi:hypothetical protein
VNQKSKYREHLPFIAGSNGVDEIPKTSLPAGTRVCVREQERAWGSAPRLQWEGAGGAGWEDEGAVAARWGPNRTAAACHRCGWALGELGSLGDRTAPAILFF